MYFRFGTFSHADNTVTLSDFSRRVNLVRGVPATAIDTMNIEGELLANTQSSIRTAIQNLENAYVKQNQQAALYHDDGTRSAHFLSPINSIGGVRVTSIRYPQGDGAEYATGRTFSITIEAEYPLTAQDPIVSWRESVSITGKGGPKFVVLPTVNGDPVKQIVQQRTSVRATQRGSAVGYYGYPTNIPGPLWPQHVHEDLTQLERISPEKDGGRFINFGVSWSYQFTSVGPLGSVIPSAR